MSLRDAAADELHRLVLGMLRVRAAMRDRSSMEGQFDKKTRLPGRPPVVLFSRLPGEEVTPPEARS